ncbi:glycosyltransferase family 4 protein [Cronbergia sp. UHCC 0137]|uniref:glycosyltransferase family 4 protein n=1 Tax=Cronbergia sp. UHCC 0137 TaxID=3110239 RepID=UPI002B20A806|nr:glycosyltransferase family 4 protein [Cronbergia sp. UHCC 0137]MEA5620804.1 glycosyltransferase family 4 protein [Cronbergia sp. UHCC 0137]
MKETPQKWLVALLGARMHYAVPRILHQAGLLEHLYTDICAIKGWTKILHTIPQYLQPSSIKRLLGRIPEGIPSERITAFNRFGFDYAQKLRQARSSSETTQAFLWAGQNFCKLILEQGLVKASGIYTFNTAGLEILQNARKQGLMTVTEQTIAPKAIEYQLLQEEYQAFPDWESPLEADPFLLELSAREQKEWSTADIVLCGSEFVRDGIIACGESSQKCQILPYGVDWRFLLPEHLPHNGQLRVLTIGAIGLRKGSPYILAAAQKLKGLATFRMVGSLGGIQPEIKSILASHVELTGSVPRSEILNHYAWADVFLLPSICEGSATVIYEALAAGLPVICTPNTGSVVRDGIEGFIVPIRNHKAIADKLELLAINPDLRREMSKNAGQKAKEFTLDSYKQRLLKILTNI